MLIFNEHSVMFRTTTKGNLCDFLRYFVAFLPHERQERATNINATTAINVLLYYQNINIIYIAIYISIHTSVT